MSNNDCNRDITEKLFAMSDAAYRDFSSKLIPNVKKDTVIGVRTPVLRKFAKELFGDPKHTEFLSSLPHTHLEENHLHAFLLEQIKDPDCLFEAVEVFLPFIDNWATCDGFSPPLFKHETARLLTRIKKWLKSGHVYTVRFAIVNLMRYFLDEKFDPEYLFWVCEVNTDDYYLHMAVAWFYATALAKQYDKALPYLTLQLLDPKTHNKTIQKAVESFRLTDKQKQYLKKLKTK